MDRAVREHLLLQLGQRTQLSSVISGKALWKVRDVLRGLGSLGGKLGTLPRDIEQVSCAA